MQLIWEDFLKIIKEEAGSQVVETWFKAVSLDTWDPATNTITLKVPNQFVSRWIQDHYTDLLKTHLARLLHAPIFKLSFIPNTPSTTSSPRNIIPASVDHEIEQELHIHVASTPDSASPMQDYPTPVNIGQSLPAIDPKRAKEKTGACINRNYRFENFVVGPNNSLAHTASWAICENVGKIYNPLFIYGGTGLGKTHLLHAIGNEITSRSPELCIRYETTDNFINEFINSIRFNRSAMFRMKYQKIDVMLFDDIQFLSNKEQTQEIFFHIFNILYEQQKQIILSSDTFPKEIHGLQSRLKSRMEWGLVADIQTPDTETKIAILKKKAEMHALLLPDEVADFIASRVISNIRELEGALVRVSAFAALTNQKITLEMAKRVLLNLNTQPKREGAMLDTILKIVAKHYDIAANDIKSKSRHQDIAIVRQVAFYMMKKMSYCSLQAIGSYIGGRNHSTVIHAISKVEQLIETDPALAQKLTIIEQEILTS